MCNYRAKRILDNKWVYGKYVKQGKMHFIITKVKGKFAKFVVVDANTISRFVIRNNTEDLYEGDILEGKHTKRIAIIRYFKKINEYVISVIANGMVGNFDIDSVAAFKKVGNKWDNPEIINKVLGTRQ